MHKDSSQHYSSIVVLTGAGISAESGIRTFRDNNGLWENHKIEEVATFEAYQRNPTKVLDFYNARRRDINETIVPNAAHEALANFEHHFEGDFFLVTQNVDPLHENSGSKNLRHMHGELAKVRCQRCGEIYKFGGELSIKLQCPWCMATGQVRPHIVWFGEMPFYMDEIDKHLSQCDLFISIGTSGNVYPAAGFVETALRHGAHTVELNLEPSLGESLFAEQHYGLATEVVPPYLETLSRDFIKS